MKNFANILFILCGILFFSFSASSKTLPKCEATENSIEKYQFASLGGKIKSRYNGCRAEIYCTTRRICLNPDNKSLKPNLKKFQKQRNFHFYYSGDFKMGKFHGNGIKKYKSGWIYEGEFNKGKYHDVGKYYNPKKQVSFKGEFFNNLIIAGVLKTPNYEYRGRFKDFQRHYQGYIKYKSGMTYDGQWEMGKWHGKGKLHQKEGEGFPEVIYEGFFKNDLEHGKGTLTYVKKQKKYVGTWKKGEPNGFFVITFNPKIKMWTDDKKPTNDVEKARFVAETKYEVKLIKGYKKHGQAKITYADGSITEVNYVNNVREGIAKYIKYDGEISETFYTNGKRDNLELEYIFGKRNQD